MQIEDIQALTASLRTEVLANPKGELVVASRNRLLSALGEAKFDATSQPKDRPEKTTGMLRRLRLSELGFARVFPVWEQFVGTKDPLRMLDTAHTYLDGRISWNQAWQIRNTFSGGLQHVYQLPPEGFHAAYAGFAAERTLSVVLDDGWHLEDTPDDERDDWWDPYFCAAAAYAHDLPWGDRFQPERFREFWLWWLDDAVLKAWNTPERWW